MSYHLNSTRNYHLHRIETLGWELTVSNALNPAGSPCRRIIKKNKSYGQLLYDYLDCLLPMLKIRHILEIGGGYGYLMKDILTCHDPVKKATMLDISPFLLEKQRETLAGFANVIYRCEDFLETEPETLAGFDLAIMNENLGDFPTVTGIDPQSIFNPHRDKMDIILKKMSHFIEKYDLAMPASSFMNINIGAMEAVEKLCAMSIPYIFLSEHSCEAAVPEKYKRLIRISQLSQPERIQLKGHDEYTMKFSHLESIARAFGYRIIRGPLADFVEFQWTNRLRVIMMAPSAAKD
jgi:SAM-dependent methyltransferase